IVGKDENVLRDILGNPIGAAWDVVTAIFTGQTGGRIEEAIGTAVYANAIPDPYLRYQMAGRLFANRLNPWDLEKTTERDTMIEVERIVAAELDGPAAADELERYFAEDPLNASAHFANLIGLVGTDPLNFFPVSWIAKPVSIPLRAVAGPGVPLSRLLRLFTPAGRRIVRGADQTPFTEANIKKVSRLDGVRRLAQMPEEAYRSQLWKEPTKGITRLLFTQPANLFADEVRVVLERRLDPIAHLLVEDIGKVADISETFKAGVPTEWVAANIPDFLSHPRMADLSARIAGEKSPVFDKALERIVSTFDDWTERGLLRLDATPDEILKLRAAGEKVVGADAAKQLVTAFLSQEAHTFANQTQQALWRTTKMGKFMQQWWFPTTGLLKGATALTSLTTPGFVWLNVVSNTVRLMWHSAFRPRLGASTLARSFWLESSTVLKTGGGYPQLWTDLLRQGFGMTPLDAERTVSKLTGAHDILGTALFATDDVLLDDSLELIQKAMLQPAKEIGSRSRLIDKVMFPVYVAGRVDKATRRATFMMELQQQIHLGTAPGGAFRNLFGPMRDRMTAAGRTVKEIDLAENVFADEIGSYMLGTKKLPEGVNQVDGEFIGQLLETRIGKIEDGVASGILSAHDYTRRFARTVLGHTDPKAEVFATRDLLEVSTFLNDDILPLLDEAQRVGTPEAVGEVLKKIDRLMEAKALEYDIPTDIARQMARLPSVIRGKTIYSGSLRVTNESLRLDMVDNVTILDRMIGIVKGDAWPNKTQSVWGLARRWGEVAQAATTENIRRLRVIQNIYDDLAEAGIERVSRGDIVPAAVLSKLPEDIVAGREAITIGAIWDDYFAIRTESFDEMYKFVEETVRKTSEAHADIISELRKFTNDTFSKHQKIISEALTDGGDDAWSVAGEKIRRLYQGAAPKRAAIAGLPVTDLPKAQQLMDPSAVLAREVHEFKDFFMKELGQDMEKLLKGELRVVDEEVQALRTAVGDVRGNWPDTRDTLLANARMATDFVMLNYLDQYGIDRIAQTVFPFEFWPTRDAFNWAIRGARAPGVFGALTIAMFNTQEIAKQYGYPQRLQNRIPIPIPGLGEFLAKMPGIGQMFEDGDFAPVYFIDPMRFIFPYTFLRDGYDDEARRNTPAGKVLDFFQNSTPLNLGPFQKFAFRNAGLLDRDAWRSTQLSGGPFGIPLTPAARAAARWLFTGDTEAISEEEQGLFLEKGHFGPKLLRDILGLDDDRFAVWRAERAMSSLVLTGELIPGAPKEEQLQKAWIAIKTHKGPEWRKAVKASLSESNLRKFTSYIGFPLGDIVGVNEGELVWFGLKAIFGEASRNGDLDEFFEKYPEFEIRSATVRGLDDPQARQEAIDTELYYQGIDRYVERPFEKAVMDLEQERDRIQVLTQTQPVRDQLSVLNAELRTIREEKERRRGELDIAFPFRERELSLNRNPRGRALVQIRTDWFAIEREEGEEFDQFLFRREEFLSQFPTVTDVIEYERLWQEMETQFMLTRITTSRERDLAFENNDFARAGRLADERDVILTELHNQARGLISRRDVESFLATFAWPKTPAQREWEQADALKDLWFTLTARGSPFTSRERGAISAYFRSLPIMQKYFPLEVTELADLTIEQRFAILRRKDFWSTYFGFRDGKTQLDYAHMMKPVVDEANRLLGLPPLTIIDIAPYPVEASGDPLFDHIEMAAALHRREGIDEDEQLSDEEREELERLLATVNLGDDEPTLTSDDISRFLAPYSVEDPVAP
nr:hypothetical protein [Chloroflexota bacterium]